MTPSTPVVADRTPTVRHRWLPQQHGGWAMLLLPLLVGVAVSRPDPWQLALAAAAIAGYVTFATLQAWLRARRPRAYHAPLAVWGGAFVVLGAVLVVTFPVLLWSLVVLVPTGAFVLLGARPGRRRDLGNSLAQVAQALLLVPAAAVVSGAFPGPPVAAATLVAAGYLIGSVTVVRSVLRERANPAFALVSILVNATFAVVAVVVLPIAYAILAAGLLARAILLPWLRRRLAAGTHPLRPIHVGVIEIVASASVVLVSFAIPL